MKVTVIEARLDEGTCIVTMDDKLPGDCMAGITGIEESV